MSRTAPTSASTGVPVVPGVLMPPVRLVATDIDLDEPLVQLGLTDGGMEVPSDYGDVGWFAGGGRPGGFGPTVLAGHVDSTSGPAVFDRLDELAEGHIVTVLSEDGTRADYRISRTTEFSKREFPTTRVFGATPGDEIRLITCSGDFDSAVGSYEENLVVFGVRL
ncbi:hypothetical protein GCM10007304_08030 [Rhodococcoides trifolii]|uniref:Class F sortase n=1 Tax=Rhodococcoides trifolii TaxID=908250 RepID=A0A917FQR9_9NOCA|nr:class F sortase [Rhodococcus trifolii]GGF96467.1 hypothetical protein GCM10007304_08030 [Rhodococcus trifolii]